MRVTVHNIEVSLPELLRNAADALSKPIAVQPTPIPVVSSVRPPRIGAPWDEQGGFYAGLCRGGVHHDYHLVLLGASPDRLLVWQEAIDWAHGLRVNDYADWLLPTCAESAVLFGNLQDHFEPALHWTSEWYSADRARLQNFSDGGQDCYGKDYKGRARAVRRVAFTN